VLFSHRAEPGRQGLEAQKAEQPLAEHRSSSSHAVNKLTCRVVPCRAGSAHDLRTPTVLHDCTLSPICMIASSRWPRDRLCHRRCCTVTSMPRRRTAAGAYFRWRCCRQCAAHTDRSLNGDTMPPPPRLAGVSPIVARSLRPQDSTRGGPFAPPPPPPASPPFHLADRHDPASVAVDASAGQGIVALGRSRWL